MTNRGQTGKHAHGIFGTLRHTALGLGVCASLAAGSLGIAGTAEARINTTPSDYLGQVCLAAQNAYDGAVGAYWDAETPEELIAARERANYWMQVWKDQGCEDRYGDIRMGLINDTPERTITPPENVGNQTGPNDSGGQSKTLTPAKSVGLHH